MKNVGRLDQILRILIGVMALSLVFIGPQTVWGWLGVIPLMTGLVNFCPLYKILGLKTCALK